MCRLFSGIVVAYFRATSADAASCAASTCDPARGQTLMQISSATSVENATGEASVTNPNSTCVTRNDARVKSIWYYTSPPGTACVFGVDDRDEGAHCIMENGDFGSSGWCYTSKNRSTWGSCAENCPLFGQIGALAKELRNEIRNDMHEEVGIISKLLDRMAATVNFTRSLDDVAHAKWHQWDSRTKSAPHDKPLDQTVSAKRLSGGMNKREQQRTQHHPVEEESTRRQSSGQPDTDEALEKMMDELRKEIRELQTPGAGKGGDGASHYQPVIMDGASHHQPVIHESNDRHTTSQKVSEKTSHTNAPIHAPISTHTPKSSRENDQKKREEALKKIIDVYRIEVANHQRQNDWRNGPDGRGLDPWVVKPDGHWSVNAVPAPRSETHVVAPSVANQHQLHDVHDVSGTGKHKDYFFLADRFD